MLPPQFPILSGKDSRRSFLRRASSLATAAIGASCATGVVRAAVHFSSNPFSLGVASGDPSPDGFVLWTRLAPNPLEGRGGMPDSPVKVRWAVAEDEGMRNVVRQGEQPARPEWAHSVHVEIEGLQPDRWYWYQFKTGNELSPVGRTRTMPPPGATPAQFRFAVASCQHYENGYFTAYQHMLKEDHDLVFHLGDYIYEDGGKDGQIRRHVGAEIITLEDYRVRHAQYRTDPALQAMHAAAPWVVTWDDHEVDNNYAGEISEHLQVPPRHLLLRRAAAYQAYYEHMPLRRASIPQGPDMPIYRRISAGNLADFFVLDTRQYRTDQPCGDANTPPCPQTINPNASLLGPDQRRWLLEGLAQRRASWNVLAQQVMMARVDRLSGPPQGYSMDQWPGYEIEREMLLKFFRDSQAPNPVVLTGDIHTHWANELTLPSDQAFARPVGAEFVATSICSGGDGTREPKYLPQLYAENPFVKFHAQERGYLRCTVTPKTWTTDYRVMEFVTRPGGGISTRASFTLESGRSQLQKT